MEKDGQSVETEGKNTFARNKSKMQVKMLLNVLKWILFGFTLNPCVSLALNYVNLALYSLLDQEIVPEICITIINQV